MEILFNALIILILFGVLFLLFKPKKQAKSKEQKQEEICLNYKERLNTELLAIENFDERQKKKIALLKVFAKELEFNLFFDREETQNLIKELAGY